MEDTDPKIVDRLSKLPPYTDDKGNIVTEPPKEVEEPKKEETPEVPVVTPTEEPTEEQALKESKQPEHTKQYIDKLKKQNEDLKRKNILESLQPEIKPPEAPHFPQPPTTNVVPNAAQFPGLTQKQVNETFKGLVDDQGYVDSGLLITALNDEKTRNESLQRELQQTRSDVKQTNKNLDDFQRNQTMRDVHAQFPKLDPENASIEDEGKKFDPKLWEYVRKEMVSSWVKEAASGNVVNPNDQEEQKRRMLMITKKGMDFLTAGVLNDDGEVDPDLLMNKKDTQKVIETDNAKRNINAIGASQTSQRTIGTSKEDRIKALRSGKKGSIGKVLMEMGQ